MVTRKGPYAWLVASVAIMAAVLTLSLACGAAEPTSTPIPPAEPAPPVAPAPVATPTPLVAPAATPTLTAAPERAIPTPTPVPALAPQYGGTLRWGGLADPTLSVRTMDPIHFTGNPERGVGYLLYNTLVGYDHLYGIQPELAKSWDISADGRSLTFHLQQGVKFHDGTEFNAEAVKWNFERILKPDSGARFRATWAGIIEKVEVLDVNTVRFRLKNPYRPFLSNLAENLQGGSIVSPTAVMKHGGFFDSNPVGTGPFKLKDWQVDNRLIVSANQDYWEKGLPYLSQITVLFVPDPVVQVAMLRTGELDFQDSIRPSDVRTLERNPNVEVLSYDSCRFRNIRVSVDQPPWNNAPLREALAYAIDRELTIRVLEEGFGRPAYSPEGDCFWWSDPTLKIYDYNPTKAKEKLAEAGFPNGVDITWWDRTTAAAVREAEFFQATLKDVGIRTKIELVPPAEFTRLVIERKIHLGTFRWTPRADPDGRLRVIFHSAGGINLQGYKNPEFERLLDEAVTIFDQAKAKEFYDKAQRLVVDKVAGGYVFLLFTTEFTAMNSRLQGYVDMPDRISRFREVWWRR